MATVRVIRKRIASVRNTQKITKAMKMVSAAKLRRAQKRLIDARPYADKVKEVLAEISRLTEGVPHPVFERRENPQNAEFLILTSDRGLCGGFNGNLLRRVEEVLKEKGSVYKEIRLTVVGKKGRDFFRSRKRELGQFLTGLDETMPMEQALKMAGDLIRDYREGKFDEFFLVYNFFRSAISQEIRIESVLPFKQNESDPRSTTYLPEHLCEPARALLLDRLIPRALATVIRRAFLESVAGEYGARMMAMDNATNNGADMIYRLTLQMNRLRQAAITKELMDIVNGAESLKKG